MCSALEQLPETVRLDVDVHVAAAAQGRAATRLPLQDAVFGTGQLALASRKGIDEYPRTAKTASSDTFHKNPATSLLLPFPSSLVVSLGLTTAHCASPWSFLGRRRVLITHAHDTCRILIGSGLKMVRTGRANKDAGAVEPKLRSVRPVRPRFCSASSDTLSSASSDNIFARPVRICFARPVRTKIRTGRAELFVRPIRPVRAFLVCCVTPMRWSALL